MLYHLLITYFAYGSNMNSDVLERRVGAKSSIPQQRCILRDWGLVFNVPQKAPGPAFASVEKIPLSGILDNSKIGLDNQSIPPFVEGCIYDLTLPQFMLLLASEGIGVAYKLQRVRVESESRSPSTSTRKVLAYTFVNSITNGRAILQMDEQKQQEMGVEVEEVKRLGYSKMMRSISRPPSRRYKELLSKGGRALDLSPEYQHFLDNVVSL